MFPNVACKQYLGVYYELFTDRFVDCTPAVYSLHSTNIITLYSRHIKPSDGEFDCSQSTMRSHAVNDIKTLSHARSIKIK